VSSLTPGFDPRPSLVGYVIDKMTPGEVFLQVLCFALSLPFDCCAILINVSVTNASNVSNLQHHRLTHLPH
jgi:hypothetical protein